MASTITARFRHVLFALALLGAAGQPAAQEYHYGIELNGVLCGYVTITASPLREGARTLTLLRHEVVVRGTLLGAGVDNRIVLTYHIDPVTKAFTYHDQPDRAGADDADLGRAHRGTDGAGLGRPRRARNDGGPARRRRARQHAGAVAPRDRFRRRVGGLEDLPAVRRPRQRGPRGDLHEDRPRESATGGTDVRHARPGRGRTKHGRHPDGLARHEDGHRRADPPARQPAFVPGRGGRCAGRRHRGTPGRPEPGRHDEDRRVDTRGQAHLVHARAGRHAADRRLADARGAQRPGPAIPGHGHEQPRRGRVRDRAPAVRRGRGAGIPRRRHPRPGAEALPRGRRVHPDQRSRDPGPRPSRSAQARGTRGTRRAA